MNIAFIPLRGGSKSIPLKNIKPFCGYPLCFWALKACAEASQIDKVVVATDSGDIADTVISFGLPKLEVYKRSAENATDSASTEAVMLEYLSANALEPTDGFVLVQATNPFITANHITEAFNEMQAQGADSLLTCVRTKRFFWNDNGTPINYDYNNRPRRQLFAGTFMENGAFYINSAGRIIANKNRLGGNICIYEMPEYTSFEIDEPDDWLIMEKLFYQYSPYFAHRDGEYKKVKLFVTDVDGVLTDAGMYYTENGDELKKFNTHDGMAFRLLREAGIKTAIITSETTALVERRAKKLKADYLYQGQQHGGKLAAVKEICAKEGIGLEEVAYIGDDINCFELLSCVGVAACPHNAVEKIKNIPGILTLAKEGGDGVVREFSELILKDKN